MKPPRKDERPKIVFSTEPGWKPNYEVRTGPAALGMPATEGQTALVSLEKRVKGKVVTLVQGLLAHEDDLAALGKKLKARCGAGGTVQDGAIEVQGDHRETIAAALEGMGYAVKRRG